MSSNLSQISVPAAESTRLSFLHRSSSTETEENKPSASNKPRRQKVPSNGSLSNKGKFKVPAAVNNQKKGSTVASKRKRQGDDTSHNSANKKKRIVRNNTVNASKPSNKNGTPKKVNSSIKPKDIPSKRQTQNTSQNSVPYKKTIVDNFHASRQSTDIYDVNNATDTDELLTDNPNDNHQGAIKSQTVMFAASGDPEGHLADRQFVQQQVAVLSRHFTLNPAIEQKLSAKRASNTSIADRLPRVHVNKALARLSRHQDLEIQTNLTQKCQRHLLQTLDEERQSIPPFPDVFAIFPDTDLTLNQRENLLEALPTNLPPATREMSREANNLIKTYTTLRKEVQQKFDSSKELKKKTENFQELLDLLRDIEHLSERVEPQDLNKEIQKSLKLVKEVEKTVNAKETEKAKQNVKSPQKAKGYPKLFPD